MATPPIPLPRPVMDELKSANSKTILGAGIEALGQLGSGVADFRSAALRATILSQNAAIKRIAAEDAIIRGRIAASEERIKTAQTIGLQRASLAANGIVVDEDSALDLIVDTAGVGVLDALTALSNAEREAARLVRSAQLDITEAEVERTTGRASFASGLLSAGRTILGAVNVIEERFERRR